MTRKSCAVGMRNAIPRNHLKFRALTLHFSSLEKNFLQQNVEKSFVSFDLKKIMLFTGAIIMSRTFSRVLCWYRVTQRRFLDERTLKWRNKHRSIVLLPAQICLGCGWFVTTLRLFILNKRWLMIRVTAFVVITNKERTNFCVPIDVIPYLIFCYFRECLCKLVEALAMFAPC